MSVQWYYRSLNYELLICLHKLIVESFYIKIMENQLITEQVLLDLGFKHIIHNLYEYKTDTENIRYYLYSEWPQECVLEINRNKMPMKVLTTFELKHFLTIYNINILK